MVTRQGGYKYVDKRTDVYVPFPVAYSKVLSIVGTPVVNAENSSGRGLENIKTYNTTSFVYYSGFDIDNKNIMAFCRYLTTKNQPLSNVPNGPNTAEKGINL